MSSRLEASFRGGSCRDGGVLNLSTYQFLRFNVSEILVFRGSSMVGFRCNRK